MFGYTIPELRAHLERQFTKGMNWTKFNAGLIHLDHHRSLSSFNLADEAELKAAWSLHNLRPLWAKANLAKKNKDPLDFAREQGKLL
jgi:hypothetical protein